MAKKAAASAFSNLVENAFDSMVQTYKNFFFNSLCPAIPDSKGKISFAERNLTFNFCSSYLQNAGIRNGNEIFVWQELDIKQGKSRGHIDSMILDLREDVNSIVIIEAKRITNVSTKGKRKIDSLKEDMDRLCHLDLPELSTLDPKWNIPACLWRMLSECQPDIYVLALVDYWEWSGGKGTIAQSEREEFEKCANHSFTKVGSVSSKKGNYYLNYCLENLNSQSGECCCSSQPIIQQK